MNKPIFFDNPFWYKDYSNDILKIQLMFYAEDINNSNNQYQKTQIGRFCVGLQCHVIEIFLSKLFRKRMDLFPLDFSEIVYEALFQTKKKHEEWLTTKEQYIAWVSAEAELWFKIWSCLKKLDSKFAQSKTPVTIFLQILFERRLVLLGFDNFAKVEKFEVKALLRKHQTENKELYRFNNIFIEQEDCPVTSNFIEKAISVPDDVFIKNYYKPMIHARRVVRDLLEKSNPKRCITNIETGFSNIANTRSNRIVTSASDPYLKRSFPNKS